ncbi:hypothetical protein AVEN_26063-1 [Araneus ventricosus]|uniref:Uncharacterized protein n=1 Tax=Araneus ventricosus TaxID=182803 RepID=A0A4Y2TLN1_ARAVE|nr:hypothetical protein AVEN_208997-1 [Araneus ventricosus]GBO01547.1 hypothetical protein AVEN_26063-1 [Araneus ventricosus]
MCRRVTSYSLVQSEPSKVTMVLYSSTECLYAAGKSSGDGTVEAFAEVTGESSDQYIISLSKSWQTRNTSDMKKFLIWLKQHSLQPIRRAHFPVFRNCCRW